jgi:E3 ubiquitin-protein ligase TRIP12
MVSCNGQVKSKCLKIIIKVLNFASPAMLRELLRGVAISSFIAGLLASREPATQAAAILLAEMLIIKLPDDYRR